MHWSLPFRMLRSSSLTSGKVGTVWILHGKTLTLTLFQLTKMPNKNLHTNEALETQILQVMLHQVDYFCKRALPSQCELVPRTRNPGCLNDTHYTQPTSSNETGLPLQRTSRSHHRSQACMRAKWKSSNGWYTWIKSGTPIIQMTWIEGIIPCAKSGFEHLTQKGQAGGLRNLLNQYSRLNTGAWFAWNQSKLKLTVSIKNILKPIKGPAWVKSRPSIEVSRMIAMIKTWDRTCFRSELIKLTWNKSKSVMHGPKSFWTLWFGETKMILVIFPACQASSPWSFPCQEFPKQLNKRGTGHGSHPKSCLRCSHKRIQSANCIDFHALYPCVRNIYYPCFIHHFLNMCMAWVLKRTLLPSKNVAG